MYIWEMELDFVEETSFGEAAVAEDTMIMPKFDTEWSDCVWIAES